MGRRSEVIQSELVFRSRGGARRGAGRKPRGRRRGVSHKTREALSAELAAHVTVKLRSGLPSLRRHRAREVLTRCFARGGDRFGMRLVHDSIQNDHLHLICEAEDRRALSRGMQGLLVRIARGLNRLWQRAGKVFADRYHDRVLRTPRDIRNVLLYVFHNARKHGIVLRQALDPFSSARWFSGWIERRISAQSKPLADPRSWLVTSGWALTGGPLSIHLLPAAASP